MGWRGYCSHSAGHWTFEGVARAKYWSSRVLTAVGSDEEASRALLEAEVIKGSKLAWFSGWLEEDPHNPAAVYDRMLPVWVMQTTGFLVEGGRRNGEVKVVEGMKMDGGEEMEEENVDGENGDGEIEDVYQADEEGDAEEH